MTFRSSLIFIGLTVLLCLTHAGGKTALAQDAGNQPPMTSVSDTSAGDANAPVDPKAEYIKMLHLKDFEASLGNLSLCADDPTCLRNAKLFNSLLCAAGACQSNRGKKAIDCFEAGFKQSPQEVRDQIESSMCAMIESPSAETRQAFLSHISDDQDTKEDTLIEYVAYILAEKGSGAKCEKYINDNMSTKDIEQYRALSGCRILSHQSSREQEEKDYSAWYDVDQGSGRCVNILNTDMRSACDQGEKSPRS
jgi:hypothetical protein